MDKLSKINSVVRALDEALKKISVENGFNFTPTVRQGWLMQIYQRRTQETISFPLITYRPELSVPRGGEKTNNTNLNDSLTFSIDCAISVKGAITPVEDLNNLLKDVRRALVFDTNMARLGVSEMTYSECPFDIPDTGDEFAFFSQKINFKVVEQYA